jgi:hypothetical protein
MELHREDSDFDAHVVHAAHHHHDRHHDSGRHKSHDPAREAYFERIVTQLARATDLWIVGPGAMHDAFASHLRDRHPAMASRVRGCEPMDHPSDGQLADRARRFFEKQQAPRQVFVRS